MSKTQSQSKAISEMTIVLTRLTEQISNQKEKIDGLSATVKELTSKVDSLENTVATMKGQQTMATVLIATVISTIGTITSIFVKK